MSPEETICMSPEETICMKCQILFSGKNKKHINKEIICMKYQILLSGKNKKKASSICHLMNLPIAC